MSITFLDLVFYKLAFGLISAAGVVVFSKKPVYAAVSFLMVFISAAFLFMMIEAEFLGFLFLIVYGGALFLLMLFGIFMIAPVAPPLKKLSWLHKGLCFGVASLIVAELIFLLTIKVQPFVWHSPLFAPTGDPERMHRLGTLLYGTYGVAMPIIGLILLTAIIGGTILIGKQKSKSIRLNFRDQMRAPSEVTLRGKGRGLKGETNP
jgi:NADH-quinone oxidoreductase subunit J